MIINMEQFGRYFTDFSSSATRIETLGAYDVGEERENYDLYMSGAPLPPDRNREWADNIRACAAAGKYMGRVHIIDRHLTPYLQFEIDWYYAVNGAAGEDIRFIFREDVPDLVYTDTWIFDDTTVLDLSYDDQGCLLYINNNEDPARLTEARAAWQEFHRRSFPLAELLRAIRSEPLAVPGTAAHAQAAGR
ncbi:DUF6879 family protein [Nocardiopsis sp. CNT312]|uniref:DUF6879 family protein n=1 Tax=Nocardiopsis sp. CNT312 TaxID=1137268 RepID=UPI0012DD6ADE|nr:DUF6879 family protein [Nocardiopsis sp. CNT312]